MTEDLNKALRLIASRLGIDADELAPVGDSVPMPTFVEYIKRLRNALPETTRHTYDPYWRVVEIAWGQRALDEPTVTEINELVLWHRGRAQVRSNSRGGRGAAQHMVSAIRCIYRHAEFDGLIAVSENPARQVKKPRRLPSSRFALTQERIVAIGEVAATTGNDPELDALIVRLHIEAACRRGGVLNLHVEGLDPDDCLILLREKGETLRWQPVSPLLMTKLIQHVDSRGGADATTRVLRYRNGRPIGIGRYDHLTERIHEHLPWAARLGVTPHWIRHTTLTFVERQFGTAVARAYAGHTDNAGHEGSTAIYTSAGIVEVAEALSMVTGQRHPLARDVRHPLSPRETRWR